MTHLSILKMLAEWTLIIRNIDRFTSLFLRRLRAIIRLISPSQAVVIARTGFVGSVVQFSLLTASVEAVDK